MQYLTKQEIKEDLEHELEKALYNKNIPYAIEIKLKLLKQK